MLQVFDFDRFSRNDVIGEVRVRIDELDLSSSLEIWGEITRNKKVGPLFVWPLAARSISFVLLRLNLQFPISKEDER